MKWAVAVTKNDFGPVSELIFGWIDRQVSLTFNGVGPESAATKEGFTSFVAVLNGFGEGLVPAHSSSLEEDEEFISLCAFVSVEKTGSSVETFGFGVDGVEYLFIKIGVRVGEDEESQEWDEDEFEHGFGHNSFINDVNR